MAQQPQLRVVIILGRPGSGKGTQADLVSQSLGIFHLESGKVVEEKLKNVDPDDPEMQKERALYLSGKWNSPEKVSVWIEERVRALFSRGSGVVFSGSMRTITEAQELMPLLAKLYGRDNIFIFDVEISEDESVERNSKRRICKQSRHPIPNLPEYRNIKVCLQDGSELITRVLDTPEIIRRRNTEHEERTIPVFDYLNKIGYKVITINGEQAIQKVHEDIMKHL